MKKRMIVLVFLAVLLLSACQKATHEVISSPPELVVTVAEDSVSEASYYFSWTYLEADGTKMGSACTPGMREDWWNQTPDLTTGAQTAVISFALPADEVSITRYSATDGSKIVWDKGEDGSIVLSPGRWTYEIVAKWTDKSRNYDGYAIYNICIEQK